MPLVIPDLRRAVEVNPTFSARKMGARQKWGWSASPQTAVLASARRQILRWHLVSDRCCPITPVLYSKMQTPEAALPVTPQNILAIPLVLSCPLSEPSLSFLYAAASIPPWPWNPKCTPVASEKSPLCPIISSLVGRVRGSWLLIILRHLAGSSESDMRATVPVFKELEGQLVLSDT